MSKPKRSTRKTTRKTSGKNRNKRRHSNARTRPNKCTKTSKLTRRNWMKKLLFKGGDASHHAENVFGGVGHQQAAGDNNNAIYQNPLGGKLPVNPV